MNREDELIETLNKMIDSCNGIKLTDFNLDIPEKTKDLLVNLEKENNKIGIKKLYPEGYGISVLSMIATITDILVDRRLAFIVDGEYITGVKWYN